MTVFRERVTKGSKMDTLVEPKRQDGSDRIKIKAAMA